MEGIYQKTFLLHAQTPFSQYKLYHPTTTLFTHLLHPSFFLHHPLHLLLPPNTIPLHAQTGHKRQPRHRNRRNKHLPQRLIIQIQQRRQTRRRDRVAERGRALLQHNPDIHAGNRVVVVLVEEVVLQQRVADGDKNAAAEGLRRDDGGGADGHVFERQRGLHRGEALLDREAEAGGGEDLVADPGGGAGGDVEGGDEAAADGGDGVAEDGGGRVLAVLADEDAREEGEEGVGEHVGDHVDAGVDGGGAAHGLEPDGQVVGVDEEAGVGEEGGEAGGGYRALQDDAGGQQGGVAFVREPEEEDDSGDGEAG